ncbi:MAG: hypothetical protein WBN59_02045 [Flavobacteriaceae bacterium]
MPVHRSLSEGGKDERWKLSSVVTSSDPTKEDCIEKWWCVSRQKAAPPSPLKADTEDKEQ